MNNTSTVTPNSTNEVKPVIYGGVDPANTFAVPKAEEKPVVYGGANPLENTATLPVVNHEAYGATTNNAVTPAIEPQAQVVPSQNVPINVEKPIEPSVQPFNTSMPTPNEPVIPASDSDTTSSEGNGATGDKETIETLEF